MYYIKVSKNWVLVYKQNLIEVTLDLFIAFGSIVFYLCRNVLYASFKILGTRLEDWRIFSTKYHFLNAIFNFWHAFQCKNGVKVLRWRKPGLIYQKRFSFFTQETFHINLQWTSENRGVGASRTKWNRECWKPLCLKWRRQVTISANMNETLAQRLDSVWAFERSTRSARNALRNLFATLLKNMLMKAKQ